MDWSLVYTTVGRAAQRVSQLSFLRLLAQGQAYQAEAPYVLAHVTMAEGFRMIASMTGVDPETVRIGQPVQSAYTDATPEWTLFTFEPASSARYSVCPG